MYYKINAEDYKKIRKFVANSIPTDKVTEVIDIVNILNQLELVEESQANENSVKHKKD